MCSYRTRILTATGAAALLIGGGIALYLKGAWIPNYPDRQAYPVRGIDVSHHQGAIDWAEAAKDRVDFAYIKATEGGDFADKRFRQNWKESGRAGIRHGAYHFFTLATPGAAQARHFIAAVPEENNALPPAVDLEFAGNSHNRPDVETFRRELNDFLQRLRDHYGTEPVLYTTYDFHAHYLRGMAVGRLWIRDVVNRPRGFAADRWTFWQFSERVNVRGIRGGVDQNVFAGNRAQFDALRIP
jgi:lysozyme